MRILFLSHYFPPEVNAPATRTYEHCRQWVKDGHQVTVVTCAPNHPQGKVYEGYRNRLYQHETKRRHHCCQGVDVHYGERRVLQANPKLHFLHVFRVRCVALSAESGRRAFNPHHNSLMALQGTWSAD